VYVISHYIIGLVVVHVFWIYVYLTGSLLRGPREIANSAGALVDLVVTSVAGMALFGFAIFAVGVVGLLDVRGFVIIAAVQVAATVWAARTAGSWAAFWTARADVVRRAATLPGGVVYAVLLVLALPSVFPYGEFDSTAFYLPYALDWSRAARIYVDESLWLPYYANNFLTLYAAFFRLGAGDYINFLTWFCGLLSALGVFAATQTFGRETENDRALARWATAAGAAVTAFMVFLPSFLRWANGSMLDIPLGLFAFAPVLAGAMALRSGKSGSYAREILVTGAFCIGMKPAFLALIPLFCAVWYATAGVPRRLPQIAGGLALLLLLASPWYVWNTIADGDPYPPLLHLALHTPDKILSVDDFHMLRSGTSTPETPASLLIVPVRFFSDAGAPDFVEYGANLSVLALYVPFIALGALIVLRRRLGLPANTVLLLAGCVYELVYWLYSSHHARFFLEVQPLFAATVGCLAVWFMQRRSVAIRAIVIAALMAGSIPSPSAWGYINYIAQARFADAGAFVPTSPQFAESFCDGCLEVQYLVDRLGTDPGHRIFMYNLAELAYTMREHGLTSIGIRLSGYPERVFVAAVEHHDLAGYLNRYSVNAMIVNDNSNWPRDSLRMFKEQAHTLGFKPYQRKNGTITMYLRPS
jgi:hypothetical protein